MPWTTKDVDGFRKGLSRKQKKKWVAIANGVLQGCKEDGGKDCDGKAVRIANSKFDEQYPFHPVLNGQKADEIMDTLRLKPQKQFQYKKQTPPDPQDNHVHMAAYDEDGNGGTDVSGKPKHSHQLYGYR